MRKMGRKKAKQIMMLAMIMLAVGISILFMSKIHCKYTTHHGEHCW